MMERDDDDEEEEKEGGCKNGVSLYKVLKTREAGPYIQARRDNPPLYLQGHKQCLLEIFYFVFGTFVFV